jgi:chromosome segregation ATPase
MAAFRIPSSTSQLPQGYVVCMVPVSTLGEYGSIQNQNGQLQVPQMAEHIDELQSSLKATEDRLGWSEGIRCQYEAKCKSNERQLREMSLLIENLKDKQRRMDNERFRLGNARFLLIVNLEKERDRLKAELSACFEKMRSRDQDMEGLEQQLNDFEKQGHADYLRIDEQQQMIADQAAELEELRHQAAELEELRRKYSNSFREREILTTTIAQLKRTIQKSEPGGKKGNRKITKAGVEKDLKVDLRERKARLDKANLDVIVEVQEHEKAGRRFEAFLKRFEHELMCPISYATFEDPVIASDGHTYDRSAMNEWFAKCPSSVATSPLTGEPLRNEILLSNQAMRKMNDLYRDMKRLSKCSE